MLGWTRHDAWGPRDELDGNNFPIYWMSLFKNAQNTWVVRFLIVLVVYA